MSAIPQALGYRPRLGATSVKDGPALEGSEAGDVPDAGVESFAVLVVREYAHAAIARVRSRLGPRT